VNANKPTGERDEHLLDLIPSDREAIVFEDRPCVMTVEADSIDVICR